MVTSVMLSIVYPLLSAFALVVVDNADTVLEQLDPPRRAAVIMALLAFVLVGVFLIGFVMIGAHWVRSLGHRDHRRKPNGTSPANQRLRNALRPILPENAKTDDTTVIDRELGDTVVDR